MTNTLARFRPDLQVVAALFANRTAAFGLVLGGVLGLVYCHFTEGALGSQMLLGVLGALWGLVGAVIYVAFLQDLDLSSPAANWFDGLDEPLTAFEPEPIAEPDAPPAPPAPVAAPRRRATPAATTRAEAE